MTAPKDTVVKITHRGERGSQGGYFPQYEEFAIRVYDAMVSGDLEEIRFADMEENVGKLDDIVYVTSDRFILLATDNAIGAPWCNWELGYGDAQKYKDKIAILPMKNTWCEVYSGNEYMQIYPHIVRVESSDISRERLTYPIERPLVPGYYVASVDSAGKVTYVSLREWINR